MSDAPNRRILVVDDTPSIHQDFSKILAAPAAASSSAMSRAKAAFLGVDASAAPPQEAATFQIESAFQGQQALEMVQAAKKEGRPFSMAFVDVRMPPGWDGIQTIQKLWEADAEIQAVVCTAYSDYSWDQTVAKLGTSDRWLILKKPFDAIEIRQLAAALTQKWTVSRRAQSLIEELQSAEKATRDYAASLETVHRALLTAKAAAEQNAQRKIDFVLGIGERIHAQLQSLLQPLTNPKTFASLGSSELETLQAIVDASLDLTTTVDAATDLTLLEAGRLKLEPGPCSIAELVRDSVRHLESRAKDRSLEIFVEYRGEIPDRATLDTARLRQILVALIGHAVTSASRGPVRVAIDLSMTERWQCPLLRCEVTYRGSSPWETRIGAPFEPFGGSTWALQLLLARQLAQRMGGDVTPGTGGGDEVSISACVETGDLSSARMLTV